MKRDIQLVTVVALCEVSSAIEDVFELHGEKIYKGILKKELSNFESTYNKFSGRTYAAYYEDNANYFERIIAAFGSYDEQVDFGSSVETRMVLIYAKLASAKATWTSIKASEDRDSHLFGVIVSKMIDKVLNLKLWNNFIKKDEVLLEHMMKSLQCVGESIYTKTPIEK